MKKINVSIIVLISIVSMLVSIFVGENKDLYKFLVIYSIIPVMFLPYFIRIIFKIKIQEPIILIYLIFVVLAHFCGTILNFYNTIPYFDKFVHTISGIASALLGFVILHKLKMYNKNNLLFNIIFIIFTSLAVASLWEFYEFSADNIFSKDAQKVATTGVTDSMTDMIVAFLGSCFISLMYWYETKTNKKLIISKFVRNI